MNYPNLLRHQKPILVKHPGQGDEVPHYVDNGLLWTKVEQVNGTTEDIFDSSQTAKTCEVRIHNHPDVTALDRLYDAGKDRTYHVDEVYEGDRELICQCIIYDDLRF